jgi:predicted acylesterase/phospholipase RssA
LVKLIFKINNRFPGSILQGFFYEKGIFDSSPLKDFLYKTINTTNIRNSNTILKVGVTSLNTGNFRVFTEKEEKIVDAVLASSGKIKLIKI